MDTKKFNTLVGIIIALAVAMFTGLYLFGLSQSDSPSSFNDGYEYQYETGTYTEDSELEYYDDLEAYTDGDESYFEEDGDADFYFDDSGNSYDLSDYEFEEITE